jgi:membrane protein YqaA with SNARE-associated domain
LNFWALLLLVSWARRIFIFFRRLGALGLFLLGIGDSSFLFTPLGNDLLLIALVSSKRESWRWVIYTCAAALGSLVGVLLVDLVMRKAGQEGLKKFVGPKKLEKLKRKLEKHCGRAVFITALLPPPFPFTALIAAASALQCVRQRMLIAVLAGRLIRFTAESILALYFGRRLLRYLRSDVVEYFVYGLIAVAIIGSILTIRKWLATRAFHGFNAH